MASLPIIESGAIDLTEFSVSADRAVWRQENAAVPPMFRRTLNLVVKPNKTNTNVNVALKLVTPVISTVDGNIVSANSRVCTVSYTALQNVISADSGTDIDTMIAALTVLKDAIIDGRLPAH